MVRDGRVHGVALAMTALAPDPAVPHRDTLLDEDSVRWVVAKRLAQVGVEVTACERVRATYRYGESLRVLHRVEVDGRTFPVGARTFAPQRLEAVHASAQIGAVPTDPLLPVALAPEVGVLLWTFPNDRKLAPVRELDSVVGELLGERPVSTALVAYAPEKSATVACMNADGATIAYAKTHAPDADTTAAAIQAALAAQATSPLRLPHVLGHSDEARTLVIEPVAGTPIADAAGFRAFGAALAALHELEPPAGLTELERFHPPRIERAARLLDRVRPDVGGAAHALAAALLARAPGPDGDPRVLHGDVHPKNALLGDGEIALIDLDQVAAGPPAAELGSALAGLEYRRVAEGADDPLGEALLAGYATVRPLPPSRAIVWHTAAALLVERAVRTISRVRPEGLERLRELLERSHAILGEGA
jgi:aminoglycoside phosphotransferase